MYLIFVGIWVYFVEYFILLKIEYCFLYFFYVWYNNEIFFFECLYDCIILYCIINKNIFKNEYNFIRNCIF